MKYIALLTVLIVSPINTIQAGTYTGYLDSIITATHFDNKVYIQTHEFYKTPTSCSKDKRFAFVFDGTTPLGKNFLAMLTAALTTNTQVYLQGSDTCKSSKSGTVETLTTLQLKAK